MFTYYVHNPRQAYRAELRGHGELLLTPSRHLRHGNPAGLPDRAILQRLVAQLGYTPRPGMRLGVPDDIPLELGRTEVTPWPELLSARRIWPTDRDLVIGLLGQNAKLVKGRTQYVVMGLSLAPAAASGHNVCVFATAECKRLCLHGTGKGPAGAPSARIRRFEELHPELLRWGGGPEIARILRTLWLFESPATFLFQLAADIDWFLAGARSHRATPVIRMNVFSDIRWENIPFPDIRRGVWAENVMTAFPRVQFYDYTKDPGRDLERLPPNYDITFSLAETSASQRHAQAMLRRGRNVAVVFNVQAHPPHPLPRTFWGLPVVDGDTSDLRFLDPRPAIVGLRFKNLSGAAARQHDKQQKYGFIQGVMQSGDGLVVAANGHEYDASAALLPRGATCATRRR